LYDSKNEKAEISQSDQFQNLIDVS